MIIRARPKFLKETDFKLDLRNLNILHNKNDELFFTSGRGALKFVLNYLNIKLNKKLNIAVQNFNCNVVVDAILESGNNVLLFDVKQEDISISYKSIKKNIDNIDILLLTHYQGLPNIEYESIIDLCKTHNILVIEDLAQSYNSSVNNIKIGTQGDFAIFSYAFDKPFSVYKGGSLVINNKKFEDIINKYNNLEQESLELALKDIKILEFLYLYSNEKKYTPAINNYFLIEKYIKSVDKEKLYEILIKKYNNKISLSLFKRVNNKLKQVIKKNKDYIIVNKMNYIKINLINLQKKRFICKDYIILNSFIDFLKRNDMLYFYEKISNLENKYNLNICWNRMSLIDNNLLLINLFRKNNIEVGNYNWPITIYEKYKKMKNVYKMEELNYSKLFSKNIINIPFWRKFNV